MAHVKWVPYHHGLVHQVADKEFTLDVESFCQYTEQALE
jgi:hypothetical protein